MATEKPIDLASIPLTITVGDLVEKLAQLGEAIEALRANRNRWWKRAHEARIALLLARSGPTPDQLIAEVERGCMKLDEARERMEEALRFEPNSVSIPDDPDVYCEPPEVEEDDA